MNRRSFLLAGSFFALTGCLKEHTTRSQLDDDAEKVSVRTVGDVSSFDNAGRVPVSGVGMVIGLEGTGGGTPPGTFREMMKEFLKRKKIEDPDKFLDSPNHALVLVSGEIPAGTRAGQRTDVQITLPTGSKVRSLRGGYLMPCELMTYASQSAVRDYVRQANPDYKPQSNSDGLLRGSVVAEAEGSLQIPVKGPVVDPDEANETLGKYASSERNADLKSRLASFDGNPEIKTAWVWRGGRCFNSQPMFLVLNSGEDRYRMAMGITDRINETLHGPGEQTKVAKAERKQLVTLRVPPQYRLNLGHFLRMIRMIPLENPDENGPYRQRLERQLMEPETTLVAALRLEALGRSSIATLRAAMKSDYPLVRFAAAESLAYLGEPIAATELAKLAQEHPSLQAYCLTALASLDESASNMALTDLLTAEQPELRYGAFRALREMAPGSETTRGELLNHCFWVHRIGTAAPSMVHLLTARRAEVVLFGDPTPALKPGFSLRAGPDIVLASRPHDKKCTISRFSTRQDPRQEQCDFSLPEVLKMMGAMGASYSDVSQMLQEADQTKSLNCPLVFDALPKAITVQQLAETGRTDPRMEKEAELFKTLANDPNSTPTLYDQKVSTQGK